MEDMDGQPQDFFFNMPGLGKRPRLNQTENRNMEAKDVLASKALGTTRDGELCKDDTELRLESILFGKPYTTKSQPNNYEDRQGNEYQDVGEHFATGLENMRDEDIFVMDDIDMPEVNASEDETPSDSAYSSEHKAESDELPVLTSASIPKPTYAASQTKSAWTDPSDEHVRISLADDDRLRKLRDYLEEDEISGRTYEGKLRRQFERMNPTPEWAINARDKLRKKRKRLSSPVSPDESNQEVEELLRSTSGLLKGSSKHSALPRGSLAIERLRDANGSAPTEGSILSLRFHPATTTSVMLTSGSDRRLRLFNIDGLTNPLLQTIHIPELRMPRAIFHPTGSSIFLSGRAPFHYTYDVQSGRVARSHHGIWGGIRAGGQNGKDIEVSSLEISKFSADGKILAVGGKHGYIHLVDWTGSLGGGQIIGNMKMNAAIKDLCWAGEDKLMSIGMDSEVYLWDVGSRRCVSRWKDDGAFSPNLLEGSAKGDYYAIGTSTGIVSVYDHSVASPHDAVKTSVNPLKEITNMTTSITSLRIDSSSQIIAVASQAKRDQLKLIHLPSLTVFSNWPTSGTPLGTVTAVDFSPRTEYIAVGNRQGRALLYALKHFSASE